MTSRPAPDTRAPAPAVSVVLHGYVWPDAAALARLQARLRETWPGAEMVDAREETGATAIGAAAAINRAAARAGGGWLVLIESTLLPDAAALAAFADPAANGLTVERRSADDARWPIDAAAAATAHGRSASHSHSHGQGHRH